MFVSIRKYYGVEDADEASIRMHASGFFERLQSLPGFKGYYAFDCGGGVGLTISLFDTLEAAEASNQVAADWVREELGSLIPNPPEILTGESIAMKLPLPPVRQAV